MLLWLGSLGGLLLFQLRPELLEQLIERLTARTVFRIQLAFAPVILFARGAAFRAVVDRPTSGQAGSSQDARSSAAVAVLSVGLLLTALLTLGLLAAVAVIIVG